jgi:hypothetical protein
MPLDTGTRMRKGWRDIETCTTVENTVANPVPVDIVNDPVYTGLTNKSYEDTDFTAGDSPFVIDFNADTGRNSIDGWIICGGGGNGDILIEISADGATYGDQFTMKNGENAILKGWDIDTIRITHSGTDSAYRVTLI